jgi:hypothetical protein
VLRRDPNWYASPTNSTPSEPRIAISAQRRTKRRVVRVPAPGLDRPFNVSTLAYSRIDNDLVGVPTTGTSSLATVHTRGQTVR